MFFKKRREKTCGACNLFLLCKGLPHPKTLRLFCPSCGRSFLIINKDPMDYVNDEILVINCDCPRFTNIRGDCHSCRKERFGEFEIMSEDSEEESYDDC